MILGLDIGGTKTAIVLGTERWRNPLAQTIRYRSRAALPAILRGTFDNYP